MRSWRLLHRGQHKGPVRGCDMLGTLVNILFVTSEVAPFAKTGGLADVSAALPLQLHRRGHDVRVFLPLYQRVRTPQNESGRKFAEVPGLKDVPLQLGPHAFTFSVVTSPLPGSDLPVYFVDCPRLYDRQSLYTQDADEHLRFLLLGWASLMACQYMRFPPAIVHCNDWQTGLVPLILRTRFDWDRLLSPARTVLTIHNLSYAGVFPASILPDTGLGDSAHLFHQEQLREGYVSFMVSGLLYADQVTTVSPTYAREIQTDERGGWLAPFLRARHANVAGILNGIDDTEWNPETDPLIPHHYTSDALEGKERNKKALLENLGLPYVPDVPVAGIVSRLAGQKGLELVLEALPEILGRGQLQLVVLGSGAPAYEERFTQLQQRFPRRVCFYRGFSNPLAHLIEAGADLFLMPSRHEPCGLNQMYSLRYGTVPVVRRTGGLADTVRPWNAQTGEGTGFLFDHFTPAGLRWAVLQALETYAQRSAWRRLMKNGMQENFSWDVQVQEYERLYARLTETPRT